MNDEQKSRSANSGTSSAGHGSHDVASSDEEQFQNDHPDGTALKLGETVQKAGSQAAKAASALATEASQSLRGIVDKQVRDSADLVGNLAGAIRSAADELDRNAPQLATLTREAADKVEALSRTLQGQTAGELVSAASDFTRRNPAMVFGGAALCGFLLVRTLTVETGDASDGDDKAVVD